MSDQRKELYSAICNSRTEEALQILERDPALLKLKTPLGSWLHVAARHGALEVVEFLVNAGLDVNSPGADSPLSYAASDGHLEVVKWLMTKGAVLDVSSPEINPLFSAILNGHDQIVEFLLGQGVDAAKKYKTRTALSFAREYGRTRIVEMLKSHLGTGGVVEPVTGNKTVRPRHEGVVDAIRGARNRFVHRP